MKLTLGLSWAVPSQSVHQLLTESLSRSDRSALLGQGCLAADEIHNVRDGCTPNHAVPGFEIGRVRYERVQRIVGYTLEIMEFVALARAGGTEGLERIELRVVVHERGREKGVRTNGGPAFQFVRVGDRPRRRRRSHDRSPSRRSKSIPHDC